MKFIFSYEKLLHHKKTLEDIARREYLLAQQAVDVANRDIAEMYRSIDEARSLSARRVAELGSASSGAMADEFIRGQNTRIERRRAELRQLMMEVEAKHQVLVEAAKEKKTLEKLKDRSFKLFLRARKKQELKEVDEIVTTRFKRGEA